jgi:putative ABC transport system permease protein
VTLLLPYHARLALRSLRRDPGLSATIVVVLALAGGIFSMAVMHWVRAFERAGDMPASLHQVEIIQGHDTLSVAFDGTNAAPNVIAARSRVSYPMYRALASSGLPARQTATFRARVLVGGAEPSCPRNARFAHGDFFSMFGLRFRHGGAWTHADDADDTGVVVLSKLLNDQLFDGDYSVGRAVLVDGRPHRVVGVLARDQPFSPEWDRIYTGGPQDVVYLPFGEHERLRARPEAPLATTPEGPTYADLLASDTTFLAFWIDLPTAALRAEYAAFLARTLGARGVPYTLRDLAAVRRDLGFPETVITFFVFLTSIVLVGAGLVMTRLLLAKGLARQSELSIFRALGAPRGAVVWRQLLEVVGLALLGGAASTIVAGPSAYLYNRLVADTDIPLAITPLSFAITAGATLVVALLFGLYPAWRAAMLRPTAALMRT